MIQNLPEGYEREDWRHSRYLRNREEFSYGAIRCPSCTFVKKHFLKWPEEAYHQITYRGKILWAYDKEFMEGIFDLFKRDDKSFRPASK